MAGSDLAPFAAEARRGNAMPAPARPAADNRPRRVMRPEDRFSRMRSILSTNSEHYIAVSICHREKCCRNLIFGAARAGWEHAMGDESIVETIKEEIAEAAKAVVAEIKSIATEVTDAVESTATLCEEETVAKDDSAASSEPPKGSEASR
jgi:uncharacterized membrane-anchored protein YjiN (DUF445 family)